MSDEILEKLKEYYKTHTKKSREKIMKILTESDRYKLQDIFQDLQKTEIWKEISEYPGYEFSSYGRIKNTQKGKILLQSISNENCYVTVGFEKKSYFVHRLIASVFLEVDEKRPFVHHINAIPFDNRVTNLKYVTAKENMQASFESGGGNEKYLRSVGEIDKNGNILKIYKSIAIASRETGLDGSTICAVCAGRRKTVKKRIFTYIDERKKPENKPIGYPVALYDTETNSVIKGPFPCATEAAKIEKISPATIYKHIRIGRKSKNNSQWRKYYATDTTKEKWLQFKNTIYEVSDLGNIRNRNTKNVLKPQLTKRNRYMIGIYENKIRKLYIVSRLVHEVHNPENFVPEYDVDHINGDFQDNRAINLQSLPKRENVQKTHEKSILQIDINGDIIEEFKSIRDAAKKFKVNGSVISGSARKNIKTCRNFFWRYSDSYNDEEKQWIKNIICIGIYRVIEQYDLTGNIIKRWLNINQVCEFYNIRKRKFKDIIKTEQIVFNCIWKYAK